MHNAYGIFWYKYKMHIISTVLLLFIGTFVWVFLDAGVIELAHFAFHVKTVPTVIVGNVTQM